MGDRVILHSDINCCYASIEHLHHPELAGKPLAVGGDPEARHGIVLTADYIAKKYGVKTGMALWQAKQVCPDITFVSPRMDLYLRFSRMAHEIYAEYTDRQEPYGIDECWLDVTGSSSLKGDGFQCRVVEISVRDNELFSFTRQKKIDHATNITGEIAAYAYQIFKENYNWSKPIRSVGVRGADLVTDNYWEQIDLFSSVEKREKQMKMDSVVDEIRRRFGFYSIQRGLMYRDRILSAVNAKEEHTVHPHGYFG